MRFIPFVVTLHSAPALDSILGADPVEEPRQSLAVSLACVVTRRIRVAVALFEMRKFLRYERQVAIARSRSQTERASTDVRCAGAAYGFHKRLEIGRIVGDTGKNRHAVDARVDSRFAQSPKRAHP